MSRLARVPVPVLVVGAVVVAVVLNLIAFAIGVGAGGTFEGDSPMGSIVVGPLNVVMLTALPLGVALVAVAVIRRWWRGVTTVALVAGPVLELGSIFAMTLPAGFDATSTAALVACHILMVPVTVVALLALRRGLPIRSTGDAPPE